MASGARGMPRARGIRHSAGGVPVSHSFWGFFLFRKLACMLAHTHPLHHTSHSVLLVPCAGLADFGALAVPVTPCGVSSGVFFYIGYCLRIFAPWPAGSLGALRRSSPRCHPPRRSGADGQPGLGPRCNDT